MKSILILVAGILIGAAALGAVLAAHHGDVTVRATLLRHDDGRVEVGIQQQGADGAWQDLDAPEARFLSPDAEAGTTYHSSEVVIPVETPSEQASDAYAAYLQESGREIGELFNEYLSDEENPDAAPGTLLCVTDANDPGIGALCQGAEESYAGAIEHLEASDWDALRADLTTRFTDAPPAAVFTTSVQTTLLGLEVEEATGQWLPWIYWIELVDQHPAAGDTPFCQVTHSGQVIAEEEEGDLFWGLASEVSTAAAGQMGVNLDFSAHASVAAQAAAIRECIANDAAVIATTLVEPDVLSPAIGEALEADIPVVSFNSGAEVAAEAGTALHIALDDHKAGQLAGEEFNQREVEGTVLCIIHEPNNVGLHDRCNGLEETYGGAVERWSAEDPAESIDGLVARMSEGDLSAVLALSVDSAWEARVARYYSEVELEIGTFGFSVGLTRSVLDGSVMFTIIDHPEMQAYLSAVALVIAERWRLDPVAYFNGMSLLIEPQVADAEYMQALLDSMFAE